ncbi:hypothetical protein RJV04_001235 [Salmonella enterica]|nr:hypothetical protein [Salmonella enterica]
MMFAIPATPAPVNCREMVVHPWDGTVGHTTPDGQYLSPVNAISALAKYLDSTDGQDVIIMMICAADITTFANKLASLSAVFPLPALNRVARRARTQITQVTARMQIPATPTDGLTPAAPLMVSTLRSAITNTQAQQAMQTVSHDLNAVKSMLAGFQQQRSQLQQTIADELTATAAAAANVFAFIHRAADPVPAAVAVMKDIPHPASSLTWAHLFTGDLSAMTGWFKEVK